MVYRGTRPSFTRLFSTSASSSGFGASRRNVHEEGDLFKRFLYAFCIFRFTIEFIRVTPKDLWGLSGFQWATLGILLLYLLPRDLYAAMKKRRSGIEKPSAPRTT